MSTQQVRTDTLVPITDSLGALVEDNADPEPRHGSVVLTQGEWGTAWQRYFSDGLWHRVGGGQRKTWAQLCRMRNVVLVYDADVREEDES